MLNKRFGPLQIIEDEEGYEIHSIIRNEFIAYYGKGIVNIDPEVFFEILADGYALAKSEVDWP